MRAWTAIGFLLLGYGQAGCDAVSPSSSPVAASPLPSPVVQSPPAPAPRPTEFAVFTDQTTGFSTSDVHDIDGQIMRFNTADEMIWVATDARFPEFIAQGNFIAYHHRGEWFFQIRFGSRDGGPRAYLTWPDRILNGRTPTILDAWVDERGDLKLAETGVAVP